jgi:hypothetical protein
MTPERAPVAIEETVVHGRPAYHAHCLACGWRCIEDHQEAWFGGAPQDGPHRRPGTAKRHAKKHVCVVRTELDVVLAPVFAFMAKARTYEDAVAIADTVRARVLRAWEQL